MNDEQKAELSKAFQASIIAEEAAMQNRAAINALRKALAIGGDGQDITTKLDLIETLKLHQPNLDREAAERGQEFDQLFRIIHQPPEP
jgi:hypothetical protein